MWQATWQIFTLNSQFLDSNEQCEILFEGAYRQRQGKHGRLYATWKSKRLRISTEIKVKNSEWSGKKIKGNGYDLENQKLFNVFAKAIQEIANASLTSKVLAPMELRRELLQIISPDRAIIKSGKKQYNLQTFLEEYIKTNPENLKRDSLGSYEYFLNNQLIPFAKKYGRDFLSFKSVDSTWDEYYIKFCTDNGYSKNTIDKYRKELKKIMRYALMKDIHSNRKFESFKRSQEESTSIYLTEDEIKEIYNLEVEKKLDLTKNLFVFSCLTGLRVSDLFQLKIEDVKEDYILIKTLKTEDLLKIPLRPTASSILKKFDGVFPAITEQKYNAYIKEICSKIPSLKKEESIYYTQGMNKRVKETYKKWQLVSTHTGRRSFATNEYLRGTPIFDIMAITGHRKVQTFMKYIRITQQEKANRLMTEFTKRDF